MKAASLMVVALATAAACSSGDLAGNVVTGDFGGSSAHVIATRTNVQFDLGCNGSASSPHALAIDADGAFSVNAVLRNYSTDRDTLPAPGTLAATITGQVTGGTIAFNIATPDYAYGPTGHFEARSGVPDSISRICRL